MSLRLSSRRLPQGRDCASLRKWGMVFLTAGVIGSGIIQNALMNMNSLTGDELLAAMEGNSTMMPLLTVALICKFVETCAAPLFALLLVEGFRRTSSFEKYLLRIGAVALVSEIPYNLAIGGKLFVLSTRNPVFGLFICLIMLFFYGRYADKCLKNTLIKLLISAAAFLWCAMLRIDHGICMVVMVGFLWMARDKSNSRAMFGFCAAMLCTVFNMYYIGCCLSCIMLHRYNDERGEQNVKFNYAFYPALLLIVGIAARFIG